MKPYRIVSLIVIVLTLAGCANTIRGVGRDVKRSANAVEDGVN